MSPARSRPRHFSSFLYPFRRCPRVFFLGISVRLVPLCRSRPLGVRAPAASRQYCRVTRACPLEFLMLPCQIYALFHLVSFSGTVPSGDFLAASVAACLSACFAIRPVAQLAASVPIVLRPCRCDWPSIPVYHMLALPSGCGRLCGRFCRSSALSYVLWLALFASMLLWCTPPLSLNVSSFGEALKILFS
jgi:hypothetical protein